MAVISRKRTYFEQLQAYVEQYRSEGNAWPASSRALARWMIETGRWETGKKSLVDLCAKEISRALREEYHTDPQGRRVRTKHAAKVPARKDDADQLVMWDDLRTASRAFMERAFKGRRKQIVDDCVQLKTDMDSYNENVNTEAPIQTIFDFTDDLAEQAAAPAVREPKIVVVLPDPLAALAAADVATAPTSPVRAPRRRLKNDKMPTHIDLPVRPEQGSNLPLHG
jgi:hypothetical protein